MRDECGGSLADSMEVILKLFLNSAAAGFTGQTTPGEMTSRIDFILMPEKMFLAFLSRQSSSSAHQETASDKQ